MMLKQQCEQLNLKHRAAQIAGRQSVQFYVYLYFANKGPQEVTAVITKIKKNGALVYVHEYGLEGVVFVGDQLQFDPETQELVTKDRRLKHSVFSRIRVRAEAQSATDFRCAYCQDDLPRSRQVTSGWLGTINKVQEGATATRTAEAGSE
ncbi:hypothetical protein ACSSS7_001951 [Eimeria intestinalis]